MGNIYLSFPTFFTEIIDLFTALRAPAYWHAFPFYRVIIKSIVMKTVLKRISAEGNQTHDGFHLGMTIAMIILFLAFWGVSFYVLLNSYA
jgi:cytosine/uracil/thiamine/allantoin permease